MGLKHTCRLLMLLCVAGLLAFWAQTAWDMQHPPVYISPWGPVKPDALQPPEPR